MFLVSLFILLIGLRVFFLVNPGQENHNALIWGSVYQVIALFGAVCGLYLSRLWGGYKSLIGRVNLAFALGLLAQSFGQTIYSYYFFKGGEVIYPSIGDIGFFGSVLFYIYGVLVLAQISGVKISVNSFFNKIQALVISLVLLILSYWIFLKDYIVDPGNITKTLLDFGYPLGQAFYVSIVLLILLLPRKVLGGIMKGPVIFFLVALVAQYFSDFTFLYQANNGTYVAGGIVDFMYFISYFLMAWSLIQLGSVFKKIKSAEFAFSENNTNFSNTTTELYNQTILAIIKRQEKVAGQIAWEETKSISGLNVVNQQNEKLEVVGDAKKVINELVGKYKSLFGVLAVEVSKDAAKHFLAELSKEQTPESLR